MLYLLFLSFLISKIKGISLQHLQGHSKKNKYIITLLFNLQCLMENPWGRFQAEKLDVCLAFKKIILAVVWIKGISLKAGDQLGRIL